jgi:hypothetical protein
MPEGELHRTLVQLLTASIMTRGDASWFLFVDGDQEHSHGCPPQLDVVRPDIFARSRRAPHVVIGEAKIASDIENQHTILQLTTYFRYLSSESAGELLMAVPLAYSGLAHRICRYARRISHSHHVPFQVLGFLVGKSVVSRMWRG